MIYNDLIDDIKSADYVLFGLGKEIYASEDKEVYDNLKKIFESMEHVNYFIVSTDKAGAIRDAGFNERRIVCPVNENNAEEEEIKFALGESTNTHELLVAQEKANIALSYTVAVRDKVIDAYKEIMNMQI